MKLLYESKRLVAVAVKISECFDWLTFVHLKTSSAFVCFVVRTCLSSAKTTTMLAG